MWKIPFPCYTHRKAHLIVALCHHVSSQCPSVLLAGKHSVPEGRQLLSLRD